MSDEQVEQRRQRSAIRSPALWKALTIYAAFSWVVVQAVDTLTGVLQLPAWFPSFGLVLVLVGLPFVLATALVQGWVRSVCGPGESILHRGRGARHVSGGGKHRRAKRHDDRSQRGSPPLHVA